MPLFPILDKAAEAPARDLNSMDGKIQEEELARPPNQSWLHVGQSYSRGAVRQPELFPPPPKKRQSAGSAVTETSTASLSTRCKAADFLRDTSADVGGPIGKIDKEANENNEDNDSGRDTIERHQKRGRKRTAERSKAQMKGGMKAGKSRKSRSHRSSRRRRSRSEDSSDDNSPRPRSKSLGFRGQQLFTEDRRGDRDNLSFGGFYRLDVPLYRRMNDDARTTQPRRNGGPCKAARYFGGHVRSINDDRQQARVQLWKGDKRRDHALGLTQAVSSPEHQTEDDTIPTAGQARHQPQGASADFLPVDPLVVSPDENASHSDPTTEREDECTESLEQWVARKTKEFNLTTRERPNCEDIWLQFADFQEEAVWALHGSGVTLQFPTAAMVRMTLEKQASILEGALRRNPSSTRLHLAALHLTDQLQEHAVVDSLWKEAIDKSDHSCTLWLRYIHFKASHFASFSVPGQRSTYARCIRALESKRETANKAQETEHRANGVYVNVDRSTLGGNKESVVAERNLLDVLWSYCIMEQAAGYKERALGVLQAMVELNIRPCASTISMDTFVSYWDSESPRIGDAHPSRAGISQWRETASTASAKPSGSLPQPGQEQSVCDRNLQNGTPIEGRGKRKRAVDFFKEESQTTKSKEPKATGGTEVLEKAYHAAMALAAVPIRRRDAVPCADTCNNDDPLPHGQTGTVPDNFSKPETLRRETTSGNGSLGKTTAPDTLVELDGSIHGNESTRAVEAEGLIWVDPSQRTAYSVRHGYRIDVQGAQDSVSGLEYERILSQMRVGGAMDEHEDRDVQAAAAASKRSRGRGARERNEEKAKQAALLEDVPDDDIFSVWAEAEDAMTRDQWQPLRSIQDAEKAEEQPDRVVLIEDIRPFLFSLSQPASSRTLVGLLLSMGGLIHPRSDVSHSPKLMSEACCAGSFGDGGLSGSLLSSVSDGFQAVWRTSEGDLPVSGKGVAECTGRPGSCLPPLVVSTAADQFLLLTDEVVRDPSRQAFLRNVLHHLVRAPESLPTTDTRPSTASGSDSWGVHSGDILVQLQCTLILFEGYLASAAGARHGRCSSVNTPRGTESAPRAKAWSDEDTHGYEARKVAKSLLEASRASATDLRLWSSYVQLLALLGNRREAAKVAEKALSMVQELPEDKKPLSAELYWLSFRLHAGLPINPGDPHAGVDRTPGESDAVDHLFENGGAQRHPSREMALVMLCSFAEGAFKRPKSKNTRGESKRSCTDSAVVTPPRLLTARKLMSDRVAHIAADDLKEGIAAPNHLEGALDMTPPFMYYSVAWVWLEYLTSGLEAAEEAMSKCLGLVELNTVPIIAGETSDLHVGGSGTGGTSAGNKSYTWKVVPEYTAHGVCLERMHRAFGELLMLAQCYNPAGTGPRRVRVVLLRGLQSFPAEPGMLCMLLETEQFSSSQQRLVHHMSEVSRRRALTWERGPTPLEWIVSATHQVMRCVREARQYAVEHRAEIEDIAATAQAYRHRKDNSLCVKNWLPGSYSRLKRALESAVTHPTGRGIPILWRMYMALEAMRGNHTQAKHLFWRAIHACPGNKSVWMDALRGKQRDQIGAAGLRPAFRQKELNEAVDAMLEKAFHLRAEPPYSPAF